MYLRTKRPERKLKSEEMDQYQLLLPLLRSLLHEMKQLSGKKQELQLNKLKVRKINEILIQTRALLEAEPTGRFLELLDDDTLPTNSDAVLIMAQHETAMQSFHEKFYGYWQYNKNNWWIESIAYVVEEHDDEAEGDEESKDSTDEGDEE